MTAHHHEPRTHDTNPVTPETEVDEERLCEEVELLGDNAIRILRLNPHLPQMPRYESQEVDGERYYFEAGTLYPLYQDEQGNQVSLDDSRVLRVGVGQPPALYPRCLQDGQLHRASPNAVGAFDLDVVPPEQAHAILGSSEFLRTIMDLATKQDGFEPDQITTTNEGLRQQAAEERQEQATAAQKRTARREANQAAEQRRAEERNRREQLLARLDLPAVAARACVDAANTTGGYGYAKLPDIHRDPEAQANCHGDCDEVIDARVALGGLDTPGFVLDIMAVGAEYYITATAAPRDTPAPMVNRHFNPGGEIIGHLEDSTAAATGREQFLHDQHVHEPEAEHPLADTIREYIERIEIPENGVGRIGIPLKKGSIDGEPDTDYDRLRNIRTAVEALAPDYPDYTFEVVKTRFGGVKITATQKQSTTH